MEENGLEKTGEIFGDLEPEVSFEKIEHAEKPVNLTVEEMAKKFNTLNWKQAALLRYMGWLSDRTVSEDEYKQALDALKNRRLGGGRR